ncbi:MAG TPA: DUF4845 domain-containing protein [Steroidobacteraceae bacterium]
MLQRQRGATVIGMIIILGIVGFALYGAIRLMPLYLEYMAVARAMDQTAKENRGSTSPADLRLSLERRWAIEDIESIDPREIEIKRTSGGFTMRASYRAEAPFIGNISLVVDFDKVVDVR